MKYIIIIGLVSLMALGCSMPSISDYDYEPKEYEITYYVEGTSDTSVCITINNKNDDTQQWCDEPLPWSYTFTTYSTDRFLYVSAQNSDDPGSITTKIVINGEGIEKNTSYGAYCISTTSR